MKLSRIEKESLLKELSQLSKMENLTIEQKSILNNAIKEIRSNGYGINYTRVDSNAYEELKVKNPVLSLVDDKCILNSGDLPNNFLIEGDNLHTLTILKKVFYNKINIIYIDPPYNTKNDSFMYKDKFEHSEWLTFMQERLEIAYELLSDDGVIFISIDDNEQASLKLLCDSIFGEDNFYGEFIQLKGNTQNDSKKIQHNHEYILCYSKKSLDSLLTYNNDTKQKVFENSYILGRDTGTSSGHDKLIERVNLGYTVYYIESTQNGATGNHNKLIERVNLFNSKYGEYNYYLSPDGKTFYHAIAIKDYDCTNLKDDSKESEIYTDVLELINCGYKVIRPPKRKGNKLGCWTWGLETFKEYWNNNEVLIKNNKNIIKKIYIDKSDIKFIDGVPYYIKSSILPLKSIIDINNSNGTKLLKSDKGILPGCVFQNPKSIELLKYLISSYKEKDSIVLDFFAGSGTTGHAVMELNKEDGGNRKFILCTNNENNICENVTYPRLKTVITGERPDGSKYSDGILSNLFYSKVEMLDKEDDLDWSFTIDDYKKSLIYLIQKNFEETLVLDWDDMEEDLLNRDFSKIKEVYLVDNDLAFDEYYDSFIERLNPNTKVICLHNLDLKYEV